LKFNNTSLTTSPIDYLAIGHITRDITPEGLLLGGTVSFAGLTALAFGLRVGIVTAIPDDLDVSPLNRIEIKKVQSRNASTFENIQTPHGRVQVIHIKADDIDIEDIPPDWRSAPIIHLGPVCREFDPHIIQEFPRSFIGVTPQGWLRTWDKDGHVRLGDWKEADLILEHASAVILSIEDVHHDENRIEELVPKSRILVVTEGAAGARVYWNGDVRHFNAPDVKLVEPTGAGDIFAAAFFIRLAHTRDPWEAARCAVQVASTSVTRVRLAGVPTSEEIQSVLTEIIPD
jgi:sugar/nucleoside kinase (ribokinase family)